LLGDANIYIIELRQDRFTLFNNQLQLA